jgi:hypothetical protein
LRRASRKIRILGKPQGAGRAPIGALSERMFLCKLWIDATIFIVDGAP